MLNRQEKEAVVTSLKEKFAQSQGSFLVGVQGLTVEELQTLRKQVRDKGGSVQVAKVRLVKRALLGSDDASADLDPYLKDQIAVVFFQEPISVAKALADFAKNNEKLRLVAGCVESDVVGAAQIKSLAAIPPREILLGHLLAAVQGPLSGLVYVLGQVVERSETKSESVQDGQEVQA
jgi:large subunit ribosomal protein L10